MVSKPERASSRQPSDHAVEQQPGARMDCRNRLAVVSPLQERPEQCVHALLRSPSCSGTCPRNVPKRTRITNRRQETSVNWLCSLGNAEYAYLAPRMQNRGLGPVAILPAEGGAQILGGAIGRRAPGGGRRMMRARWSVWPVPMRVPPPDDTHVGSYAHHAAQQRSQSRWKRPKFECFTRIGCARAPAGFP